ncbi:Transcriptional regulator [Seminavis robusta]|uniref:Transcriptional regulator n=1 Tax=Seminavis robusta TaxID=568900 RepID=A0A9N8E7H0_9STRA|nr:Transcriptional regulator [Seminavis robusta]|eukprot:Sro749_g196840.1 Transcriptional regulator (664) ;mRNA; f:33841-35980
MPKTKPTPSGSSEGDSAGAGRNQDAAPAQGAESSIEPRDNDVLFGRGDTINRHPGNKKFRELVDSHKRVYLASRFKQEKRMIADGIVAAIAELDPPGRFLAKNASTGLWNAVDHGRAREKTLQALREKARSARDQMEDRDNLALLQRSSENSHDQSNREQPPPAQRQQSSSLISSLSDSQIAHSGAAAAEAQASHQNTKRAAHPPAGVQPHAISGSTMPVAARELPLVAPLAPPPSLPGGLVTRASIGELSRQRQETSMLAPSSQQHAHWQPQLHADQNSSGLASTSPLQVNQTSIDWQQALLAHQVPDTGTATTASQAQQTQSTKNANAFIDEAQLSQQIQTSEPPTQSQPEQLAPRFPTTSSAVQTQVAQPYDQTSPSTGQEAQYQPYLADGTLSTISDGLLTPRQAIQPSHLGSSPMSAGTFEALQMIAFPVSPGVMQQSFSPRRLPPANSPHLQRQQNMGSHSLASSFDQTTTGTSLAQMDSPLRSETWPRRRQQRRLEPRPTQASAPSQEPMQAFLHAYQQEALQHQILPQPQIRPFPRQQYLSELEASLQHAQAGRRQHQDSIVSERNHDAGGESKEDALRNWQMDAAASLEGIVATPGMIRLLQGAETNLATSAGARRPIRLPRPNLTPRVRRRSNDTNGDEGSEEGQYGQYAREA